MCHLAMLEGIPGGEGTTWLEPATDEQYQAANEHLPEQRRSGKPALAADSPLLPGAATEPTKSRWTARHDLYRDEPVCIECDAAPAARATGAVRRAPDSSTYASRTASRRRPYQSFGCDTSDAADRPSLATYRRIFCLLWICGGFGA